MAVYEINSIFSKPVLLFYCCFFCYMQYSLFIYIYIYITLFPPLHEDLQLTEEQKKCKKIDKHSCTVLSNYGTEKKTNKERNYRYKWNMTVNNTVLQR